MSIGPGSIIGPFKIQSFIGKGGMGEVFSATDPPRPSGRSENPAL
jgi:hypothetical protein